MWMSIRLVCPMIWVATGSITAGSILGLTMGKEMDSRSPLFPKKTTKRTGSLSVKERRVGQNSKHMNTPGTALRKKSAGLQKKVKIRILVQPRA